MEQESREQVRRDAERDPFADDVLERLIASNQDYQRAHGHYIVPLSMRLLKARAALEQAERDKETLSEANRALQRSAIANRDGRKIAEARLASVPALVEAALQVLDTTTSDEVHKEARRALVEALTVYEQSQGNG